MANNFLKYSHLSYDDIIKQIRDKISEDPRFDNFKESAIAQMFIEIFAGTVDLISYYLERRAEECFLDTARHRSSVILLARSLGYSITRPIPAKTTIKVILKGNCNNLFNDGERIQIPLRSVFSYNNNNYILLKTFNFTITPEINSLMSQQGDDFEYEIEYDDEGNEIFLLQGDIIEKVFEGISNNQVASKFQFYKIEDPGFSNLYGYDDFQYKGFYKNINTTNFDKTLTRVWVGDSKSDENEFKIDTKSLLNFQSLNSFEAGQAAKICVIRTSLDGNVELLFGDDRFARIGARNLNDNIYIQYLSTKGSLANENGVINKEIQYSGSIFNQHGTDITDKFKFKFRTNIVDGTDIEDIESIRVNAPAIFYSLDRLVSKKDYIAFLKSITSPVVIKNAIVWGEQEEIFAQNKEAIRELFNVVLFSVVGSLYNSQSTSYLEDNYDPDALNDQSYFNVYIKNNLIDQLYLYIFNADVWKINSKYWTNFLDNNLPDRIYLNGSYSNSATLNFIYGSDNSLYASHLLSTSNIVIDFSDLSTYASDEIAMIAIANKIQSALRSFIDKRGGNTSINTNYGKPAFPNVKCTFNTENVSYPLNPNAKQYYLTILFDVNDKCYIKEFDNSSLNTDLGLTSEIKPFKVVLQINRNISKGIIEVTNELNKRAQITVKHVYISPIVHNYNINGSVYVSPLYDKEKLKNEIESKIYNWLDINADFNIEIFKSNIIEIIESFKGVNAVDIVIQPKLPYNPTNKPFFTSASIRGDYSENDKKEIYDRIIYNLEQYLSLGNYSTNNKNYDFSYYDKTLQSATFLWNNNINERTFLTQFCKSVYNDNVINSRYAKFKDSLDFINCMNDIHKDLLYMIRSNILDSNGNIAAEIRNGVYFRGGYSLGNEIVRLYCNMNYFYRN